MDRTTKSNKSTVQRRDTSVPATAGSAKAVSRASLSSDCSTMEVDHLASTVYKASSEEDVTAGRRELVKLGKQIENLLDFVTLRHNVHSDIKKKMNGISLSFKKLLKLEDSMKKDPTVKKAADTQT